MLGKIPAQNFPLHVHDHVNAIPEVSKGSVFTSGQRVQAPTKIQHHPSFSMNFPAPDTLLLEADGHLQWGRATVLVMVSWSDISIWACNESLLPASSTHLEMDGRHSPWQ